MNTLVERKVPHRLVVVSSDGSTQMEAVVAALLNICVDSDKNELNAINRRVCGGGPNQYMSRQTDEQELRLKEINIDTEMIICAHCNKELHMEPKRRRTIKGHSCPASNLPKRVNGRYAMVCSKRFAQAQWCPNKDTCNACAVIVPRLNDILQDLPPQEILLKNSPWKKERQRLVLRGTLFRWYTPIPFICIRYDRP